MKKVIIVVIGLLPFFTIAQQVDKVADPVERINSLMGSESSYELSNGNTYPAIALPSHNRLS